MKDETRHKPVTSENSVLDKVAATSFKHQPKLDIFSQTLHMLSSVLTSPSILEFLWDNKEFFRLFPLILRLPTWVPIRPKHVPMPTRGISWWHLRHTSAQLPYSAKISSANVTKSKFPMTCHSFILKKSASWYQSSQKHMGNTQKDVIHTTKHMQLQYKISLHDVQIATWKNHAIN